MHDKIEEVSKILNQYGKQLMGSVKEIVETANCGEVNEKVLSFLKIMQSSQNQLEFMLSSLSEESIGGSFTGRDNGKKYLQIEYSKRFEGFMFTLSKPKYTRLGTHQNTYEAFKHKILTEHARGR